MGEISLPADFHEALQSDLRDSIGHWQKEVAALLPTLPSDIAIQFDNNFLIPGFGTGGAAIGLNSLKLAYDPTFNASEEELKAELRATYYHECYHLARGISFETTPHDEPAISNAVEEGLATKFEMVFTNSNPGYARYEDRATMLEWLQEVRGLPDGFDYDWERWKFFDSETGRKWILYKVGVFIVDEAFNNNPELTIEGMSTFGDDDVIALSKL